MEAQKNQIKQYFAACQPAFERIYAELAIRQPERPWLWLSEAFAKIPQAEKDEWLRNLNPKASGAPLADSKTKDPAFVSEEVHLHWKLTLRAGSDLANRRSAVIALLNEIRSNAILAADCHRFEILTSSAAAAGAGAGGHHRELLVAHSWATAAAWDRYTQADYVKKHAATLASLIESADTQKFQRL